MIQLNRLPLLKALRIDQYVKNLFIFAPLFFSFQFTLESSLKACVAFVLFSILASSIYLLNDLMDIEEDKKHPIKRFRPLAAGELSKQTAKLGFTFLAGISLVTAYFWNLCLFNVLLIYCLLNIAYSLRIKHIAILDIFVIATGFVLRLFAGGCATNTPLSMWVIIITFLLALFLAIAKRRDDVLLARAGKQTRKNIDGYNLEFINAVMVSMAAVIIVAYILYTVSDGVLKRLHSEYLYLTSFFVILGVIRYMQLTFVEERSGSPTKIVISDGILKLTILFWLISFFAIVKA